jgi:hypothetical protein
VITEQAAAARLALSRERLRQALSDATSLPPTHVSLPQRASEWALTAVQRLPGPWLLGALLAGGLLLWMRPTRSLLRPMAAAWLPQVVLWAVSRLPLQSWASVLAMLAPHPAPPSTPPVTPVSRAGSRANA